MECINPYAYKQPLNKILQAQGQPFLDFRPRTISLPYFQDDFEMPRPDFFRGSQEQKQNDLPKGRQEPPLEWVTWDSLKLWIRELPPNVATLELWTNFKKLGNIKSIDIFVSKSGLRGCPEGSIPPDTGKTHVYVAALQVLFLPQ